MRKITFILLNEIFVRKGYVFFQNGSYNLNIVGIRSKQSKSNEFDDLIVVAYKDNNLQWQVEEFEATTDPGKPWLLKPMTKGGTAILVPGQYRGAYKIGIHGRSFASGGYEALEQVKPMKYVRDNNKDSIIDFALYENPFNIIEENAKTNIHRANKNSIARLVETHSAGCQVIKKASDFEKFMNLCRLQRAQHGNSFTYTLIEEKDLYI